MNLTPGASVIAAVAASAGCTSAGYLAWKRGHVRPAEVRRKTFMTDQKIVKPYRIEEVEDLAVMLSQASDWQDRRQPVIRVGRVELERLLATVLK